ncbi:MAG TPA: TIGR03905 family TSCPD domain-containing protein [Bacillota bacterium]|nr:TIGR03905 family TSCPD domain-containing protein [Clostridiaceae bacterium]HOJ48361.1 TIGR03905 family TSCPD domain-containing protein [Bacillota bacterium]HOK68579.1 TIGR03905 family TSCPD domain-containing protein [Bacillota bacterium]HPP84817.1 TIGR03905 family TSCPD domain-containing protein [Bacillota bacterium]
MRKTYKLSGVCAYSVSFDIDDNGIISGVSFSGGCNGNLKGIAALCEGMSAKEIIKRLDGICCGLKRTSCPDQFSKALMEELKLQEVNV